MKRLNSTQVVKLIASFLALAILLDFALPGREYHESISDIETKRQRYYNAAGNSHLTYHAQTNQGEVMLSEAVAKQVLPGDTLVFRKSLIFHANNGHYAKKDDLASFSRHSMRWFSGLVFPLVIVFFMLYKWRNTKQLGNFKFVLVVFLFADLAYLLFL